MKINNVGNSGINPYKRQMNKLEDVEKQTNKRADKVEISSTAKEMQQLSQYSAARKEKIEQIKISVEDGTYKVNPEDVAKSMMDYYTKGFGRE